MAIRYAAVSTAGAVSESLNNQSALATAVSTAITAAGTANAAAGAKADVTTELAAVTTALTALTANQPSGGIVVSVDLSSVTTKNKLRQLLDAAYEHFISTNQLT
jgi:hypothetical protein